MCIYAIYNYCIGQIGCLALLVAVVKECGSGRVALVVASAVAVIAATAAEPIPFFFFIF